jgi:selenide,water dikinase
MTDVTGFGLLGHLLGVCRGSGLRAVVEFDQLPVLPDVMQFAADGVVTGASARNWTSYGESVVLGASIDGPRRALLTDPQTSGGLLVSCEPGTVDDVVSVFARHGCEEATVVGRLVPGSAGIEVG